MTKDYSSELEALRARIDELEELIANEPKGPDPANLQTFEVVLTITTDRTSWMMDQVDELEVMDMFKMNMTDMVNALGLIDEGDEVKVRSVTEIV